MTLASLKAKKRDMDEVIYYWTATAEGTKALRSQGMLDEVHGLYDMMEVVWPDERRIKDLRGLLQ